MRKEQHLNDVVVVVVAINQCNFHAHTHTQTLASERERFLVELARVLSSVIRSAGRLRVHFNPKKRDFGSEIASIAICAHVYVDNDNDWNECFRLHF